MARLSLILVALCLIQFTAGQIISKKTAAAAAPLVAPAVVADVATGEDEIVDKDGKIFFRFGGYGGGYGGHRGGYGHSGGYSGHRGGYSGHRGGHSSGYSRPSYGYGSSHGGSHGGYGGGGYHGGHGGYLRPFRHFFGW